jgi:hypothetical protein
MTGVEEIIGYKGTNHWVVSHLKKLPGKYL